MTPAVDDFYLFDDMQYTRRATQGIEDKSKPGGVGQVLTLPMQVKGTHH